jgi:hypothetical protein
MTLPPSVRLPAFYNCVLKHRGAKKTYAFSLVRRALAGSSKHSRFGSYVRKGECAIDKDLAVFGVFGIEKSVALSYLDFTACPTGFIVRDSVV